MDRPAWRCVFYGAPGAPRRQIPGDPPGSSDRDQRSPRRIVADIQHRLYIDPDNVYHRGDFFIISSVVACFYILYGIGTILTGRRRLIRQEFQPLVLFGILPLAGGIAQTLYYGPLLMWSSTAFSPVITYAFLQQRMVHPDHLTGAWSRQPFGDFIARRLLKRGARRSCMPLRNHKQK